MRPSPENRAAVVGAAGFIGSALTRRLREAGVEVDAYTRSVSFLGPHGGLDEKLACVRSVFWLASSIRPATAAGRLSAVEADRTALARLIDGLDASASSARLITVSSGGTVYDTSLPAPYREESPVRAANAYGQAMLEIERLVRAWGEHSVLRVSNAYGPGQQPRDGQGVIAHWLSAVAAEDPLRLVGSDQVARDYIYIDDVVDALIAASQADGPPSVVNIGSGQPTTLAELLSLISDAVSPQRVEVRQEPARVFDAPSTWLDISLARRELGWVPGTTLAAGLGLTWGSICRDRSRST
jgi:UDP-glucose 4-epimerase